MAPEIRSIIRYMDDYIASGDYGNAIDRAIQALHIYDQEREYDNSIKLLEKLIEIAEHQDKKMEIARYVENIKIRALLSKNSDKFETIKEQYSNLPSTPFTRIINQINDQNEGNIIIEGVELQSIFGEFEPMENIPYITFDNHETAVELIEDYYGEGRYLIHLLDRQTSLHQAINLDVGNLESANIVDRDHIYRIKS